MRDSLCCVKPKLYVVRARIVGYTEYSWSSSEKYKLLIFELRPEKAQFQHLAMQDSLNQGIFRNENELGISPLYIALT